MKDANQIKTIHTIKELSEEDIVEVNGGFLGALLAIAVAALAGCASAPKKPHPDDLNYHQ